jgi:hypothetical protein
MKIRPLRFVVFFATLAINNHSAGQSAVGETQAAPATQNVPAVAQNPSAVRFLAPQPGEKLQQNAVTVRYAVDQPQVVAASTPRFRVRLDRRDPVETTEKEATFTGLAVGNHMLVVEAVDANGTPVQGTHTEIQFSVLPEPVTDPAAAKPPAISPPTENPGQQQKKRPQHARPPQASSPQPKLMSVSLIVPTRTAPARAPENTRPAQDAILPQAGSTLPLLTVIGAGVLIGGLFSARKTRPARSV